MPVMIDARDSDLSLVRLPPNIYEISGQKVMAIGLISNSYMK
jgi:hypothetical protein